MAGFYETQVRRAMLTVGDADVLNEMATGWRASIRDLNTVDDRLKAGINGLRDHDQLGEATRDAAVGRRVVVLVPGAEVLTTQATLPAGSTGIDEPPGMQAFNFNPPRIPPAISSSCANGVPSLTSKLPGRATSPETENILVPPLFGRPSARKASAPLRMIHGTAANVSVLLMVVGLPYSP